MPESKLRRPGVYSTPDAKPPPKPPVTPEHSKLKGPAPALTSTPSRLGALSSARGDSAADTLEAARHDKWVKEFFRDKIVWDVDPSDFIKGVWGDVQIGKRPFPNQNRISFRHFQIDAHLAEEWAKAETERESYEPLRGIMNDLIAQTCGVNGEIERLCPAFYYVHDRRHEGAITLERMDRTYSTVVREGRLYTDFEHAFVEVKKTDRPHAQMVKTGAKEWATNIRLVMRPPGPTSSPAATSKRKRETGEDVDRDAKRQSVQKERKGKGRSRDVGKHSTPSSHDGTPTPSGASGQSEGGDNGGSRRELTSHEVQAVRYMNNLMSSNVRSFGIGILIETDDMRLWYGDRMGLIVSKKFKWLKEDNWTFLRCITAIARASEHEMGIHPSLQFPRFPPQSRKVFFSSYEGAHLSMTARRPDAEEAEELEFALDVKGNQVYAEFGLVGRGTSVVPIVAKPETRARELFQDEELVAKISWPHAARRAEDSMIFAVRRALKEKKPQYLRYVVDLKCSTTRTIGELGLPRAGMNIIPEGSDLRVCRMLVMKRYQRLEMIESVDNFKKVFIDVVRVHYWVYTTSRILHRDLSTNNVMWYHIGNRVYGVLCDWDLAEVQADGDNPPMVPYEYQAAPTMAASMQHGAIDGDINQEGLAFKPRYRTGTGPFMAMDLLRPGLPPPHLYRHDLESLLYLLVYVCVTLDLQEKKFRRLPAWERESLLDIGRNKRDFLLGGDAYYETFVSSSDPAFKPLVTGKESWAYRLWHHFAAIEVSYISIITAVREETGAKLSTEVQKSQEEANEDEEEEEDIEDKYDDDDDDGVSNSQPSSEQLKRRREKLITYAKFMDILGAPKSIRGPV